MDYLLILKNGLGNKIFILVNFLHKYKNVHFHIVDGTSHHQEGLPEEKIWHLFPRLKEVSNVSFIRWREYDELKKTIPEFEVPFDIFYVTSGFKPSTKKLFVPASEYQALEEKYDFKKGIFVHFRLGDKFVQNYHKAKKGKELEYVVMKPEFYEDHISELRKKDEPVYIFSDQPSLAKCLLTRDNYMFVDEGVNETFYCFQNARRVILSESTLTIAAVLLGSKKKDLIVPNFLIRPMNQGEQPKLIPSPYFSEGESNKKYLLRSLTDYIDIVKKCRVKLST
jgi:hypothetical protein